MSIQLIDVGFTYSGGNSFWGTTPERTPVLREINLAVEKGERVALLGASGSGKSTLAKIIASIIEPNCGRVRVGGNEVTSRRPFTDLGFIKQDAYKSLFPWMTVERTVKYPLKLRGFVDEDHKSFADQLIRMLQLEDAAKHYPNGISGGEQKRLSLAMGLSYKPSVILLDEPLTGADINLTRELWDFLFELFESYKPTVLLITHDLDEAMLLADRVVFLRKNMPLEIPERGAKHFNLPDRTPRFQHQFCREFEEYKGYLFPYVDRMSL